MPTRIHLLASHAVPPSVLTGPAARQWLSEEEIQAALRGRNDQVRHRKLTNKILVRALLGQHLNRPPAAITISRSDSGKPYLPEHPDLHFNLSHSGDWVAIAISEEGPVGVDIEHPRRRRSWRAIARQYFHPAEVSLLQTLKTPEAEREFYRLWTLKEAFFKGRGTGIAEGLGRIDFSSGLRPNAQPGFDLERWRFCHWSLTDEPGGPLFLSCSLPKGLQRAALVRDLPPILG